MIKFASDEGVQSGGGEVDEADKCQMFAPPCREDRDLEAATRMGLDPRLKKCLIDMETICGISFALLWAATSRFLPEGLEPPSQANIAARASQ